MIWKCADKVFDRPPYIMGVLNVTPDSFSDGGQHSGFDAAMAHARRMLAEGADIIDVGGESTRPGSSAPSIEEEIARVLPVVRALAAEGVCVSIDTRHHQVANICLQAGASIINDVSGFRDLAMRELAAGSNCGLVVMHMLGEPGTMQDDPQYENVVAEVGEYLSNQVDKLVALGVDPDRICIDPGPGFGKTVEHNVKLIEGIPLLALYELPVMVAVSRKSFIGALTGIEEPARRDAASALCAASACANRAFVARVHDVAATVDAFAESRRAYVALGSNMENPVEQLNQAVAALRKTPGIWVTKVSPYVESEPAYKEDQATFVNAVARVQTMLQPEELLRELQRIENEQGRVRLEANGPRTLDLDVLDYEGVVSSDPVLTLPHPRICEREFVVKPLMLLDGSVILADGTRVTGESASYGRVIRTLC